VQFDGCTVGGISAAAWCHAADAELCGCGCAERACQIDLFSNPSEDLSGYFIYSGWLSRVLTRLLVCSGMKDKDAVLLLDYRNRKLHILQLPLHEQVAEINKLSAEISSIHFFITCFMMAPNFRVHSITLRVEGGIRCAEMAMAVERYRLKYGGLPETLDGLVPEFLEEVYLDPFDGKPLRYVLRPEGGYTIYCIGEDGVDNGGGLATGYRGGCGRRNMIGHLR
jgi:hypothetical protein